MFEARIRNVRACAIRMRDLLRIARLPEIRLTDDQLKERLTKHGTFVRFSASLIACLVKCAPASYFYAFVRLRVFSRFWLHALPRQPRADAHPERCGCERPRTL